MREEELKVKVFNEITQKLEVNPLTKQFANKLEIHSDKLLEKAEESAKHLENINFRVKQKDEETKEKPVVKNEDPILTRERMKN